MGTFTSTSASTDSTKPFLNLFQIVFLLVFVAGIQAPIHAQKPVAEHALEMLIDESEPAYMANNRRISEITEHPLALYGEYVALGEGDPEDLALQYLTNYRYKLDLNPDDVNQLKHHATRKSLAGTVVRFRQYKDDLPVNEAEITVTINRKNAVVMVINGFRYDVTIPSSTPAISLDAARQTALDYLEVEGTLNYEKSDLMIYTNRGESRLAFRIRVEPKNPLGDWEVLVDAQTGIVFKAKDRACYYKGKKHVHPKSNPVIQPIVPLYQRLYDMIFVADGTGNVWDNDPLSTANETYGGNYSDNGDATNADLDAELQSKTLLDLTLTGGTYSLVGPYAEIQDFENPTTGLFSQGNSTFDFDREEQGFEAVNCYYHIDQSMRYINETLNITLMPYQYTGGVRYDPHGFNGADNAHYLGGTGRVSFGEGGVDDAEDTDVVLHELGHGLHHWVTNNGLSQVNGLSEGCGDYWASSYRRSLNLWSITDDEYFWVFGWDGHNEFWNGRVTNYAPLYPVGLTGGIHADGQIWSTSLLKIYEIIGRTQTDIAFLEGLGMTNGSSNQNDAAVAVYNAAVSMGYPSTQLATIHSIFTATGYTLPIAPLPVEMATFTAEKSNKGIELNWTTASEFNNDYFDIERSTDGRTFTSIGTVKGNGTTSIEQTYQYLDAQPLAGINYYRLRQLDLDGRAELSEIRNVMNELEANIRLYSPADQKMLNLEASLATAGTAQIGIYNAGGQLISESRLELLEGQNIKTVDLNHLPAGIYIARFDMGNISKSTKIVLK